MDIIVIYKDKYSADENSSMDKQSFIKKSRDSKKAQLTSKDDINRANKNQDILNHRSETFEFDSSELLCHIEDNEQQFFFFIEDIITQLTQLENQLKQVLLILESLKQLRAR